MYSGKRAKKILTYSRKWHL